MEKKYTQNNFVRLTAEEEILWIEYKEQAEINLPGAVQIMELMERFCEGKKFFILEDMSNIKWIDKRSRDYLAQHPLNAEMKAWAYCSSQSIHKIMYEIYNTFSRPRVNTAFFTTKEEGLNWLSGFRNESPGL